MTAFKELLTLILNGDSVDAPTINRILRELHLNSSYLRDVFEAAALGETVFARGVTVEPGAAVGMGVYYNETTNQWERAQAVADISDGTLVAPAKAQVWGIVHTKLNSTSADLLLLGTDEIDMSAAIDGTASAGQYFLSGSNAGKLVKTSPPVGIPVLQVGGPGATAGTSKVFVKTNFLDFFNAHQHYKFDLTAAPAGIAQLAGGRWTIPVADANSAGWLPAGHATFSGNAPQGAVFGYNLDQSTIGGAWPPMPLSSVHFEWDRGIDLDVGGTAIPQGPTGLIIADANGIWWMSDCTGDVPWPDSFDSPSTTTSTTTTPAPGTTTSTTPECPRVLEMRITAYFTKMAFQTNDASVTSLTIGDGSETILTLTCPTTGDPATTGPLQLDFKLPYTVSSDDDSAAAFAFKEINGTNQFLRGPILSGLKSGSSNVLLSGGTVDGDYRHGQVTLAVTEGILGGELPIETVRLDGVTEEFYEDILGFGFPAAKTTSFRGRLRVPATLAGVTSLQIVWRCWLLGRAAGTIPPFTMVHRIISRPSPTTTPIAIPTADAALTFDTSVLGAYTANQYAEVQSVAIVAAPGDIIDFGVTRPGAGGDGYSGEIHVINQVGVITGSS